MSKHGRAFMPFGEYKGCQIKMLPNDYLCSLATWPVLYTDQRWDWLAQSILSEIRHRGLNEPAIPAIVAEKLAGQPRIVHIIQKKQSPLLDLNEHSPATNGSPSQS